MNSSFTGLYQNTKCKTLSSSFSNDTSFQVGCYNGTKCRNHLEHTAAMYHKIHILDALKHSNLVNINSSPNLQLYLIPPPATSFKLKCWSLEFKRPCQYDVLEYHSEIGPSNDMVEVGVCLTLLIVSLLMCGGFIWFFESC